MYLVDIVKEPSSFTSFALEAVLCEWPTTHRIKSFSIYLAALGLAIGQSMGLNGDNVLPWVSMALVRYEIPAESLEVVDVPYWQIALCCPAVLGKATSPSADLSCLRRQRNVFAVQSFR